MDSAMTTMPRYSIHARDGAWHVLFRVDGRQVKRRVGPVHEPGRPKEGALNRSAAEHRAREIVAEHLATIATPRPTGPTFREVAHDYMHWLERVRGAKPSTLADHRYLLAESNGTTKGRIMDAIGDRAAAEVTPGEMEQLLDDLAAGPRTTNN
jgi:hypothetical protein